MVNLLSWLRGEAIMDLLSEPEVLAADYVIKSIIISVWTPLLLCFKPLFFCVAERNTEKTKVHTHKLYKKKKNLDYFYIKIKIIWKLKEQIKSSSQWKKKCSDGKIHVM